MIFSFTRYKTDLVSLHFSIYWWGQFFFKYNIWHSLRSSVFASCRLMIALHELQTAQTLRLHWLKIKLILVGFSYRPFIEFSKYHFYCRFCIHFFVLLVLFVFVFFQTLSLILDNCLFVKTEILLMTLAT